MSHYFHSPQAACCVFQGSSITWFVYIASCTAQHFAKRLRKKNLPQRVKIVTLDRTFKKARSKITFPFFIFLCPLVLSFVFPNKLLDLVLSNINFSTPLRLRNDLSAILIVLAVNLEDIPNKFTYNLR